MSCVKAILLFIIQWVDTLPSVTDFELLLIAKEEAPHHEILRILSYLKTMMFPKFKENFSKEAF